MKDPRLLDPDVYDATQTAVRQLRERMAPLIELIVAHDRAVFEAKIAAGETWRLYTWHFGILGVEHFVTLDEAKESAEAWYETGEGAPAFILAPNGDTLSPEGEPTVLDAHTLKHKQFADERDQRGRS